MPENLRLVRLGWPAEPAKRALWEELRLGAPTETPFLTPEWLETWWHHLSSGGHITRASGNLAGLATGPLILGVQDRAHVIVIAPFYRTRPIPGCLVAIRPLGVGVSDYLDLLLPAEDARRERCLELLLDGLLARPQGWDVLDLPNLPAESPTVSALVSLARARGLRHVVLPGYPRPGIALEGTWEDYLRSRSGRFRYNLRSRLRRLGQLGEVRLRTVSAPAELEPALRELTRLHARRWAGQHTGTIFSSSGRGRAFYAEAVARCAARGLVELTLLEVAGQAVAGSLSFVDRGCFYYYMPAWEPDLAAYAPSSLLLAHLVESAFERGLRRFDFMLGDEPYKAQWATEERQIVRLILANRDLRARAAFHTLVAAHRVRQRARSSRPLQALRRRGLGWIRQLLSPSDAP